LPDKLPKLLQEVQYDAEKDENEAVLDFHAVVLSGNGYSFPNSFD